MHAAHQPLVAQVGQHEQFRMRAQGHQRDQLALVDIDRQGALRRDGGELHHAMLVDGLHLLRERCARLGQPGKNHWGSLQQKGRRMRRPRCCKHNGQVFFFFLAGAISAEGCFTLGGLAAVPEGECAPAVSSGFWSGGL